MFMMDSSSISPCDILSCLDNLADTRVLAQVVGAAASGVVSFAVDALGCVWSWGTSKRGQLGQGMGIAQSRQPQRLPGLEGIVSVACGWGHALALRGGSFSLLAGPAAALVLEKPTWELLCSELRAMCMQGMGRSLHGVTQHMGAWATSLTQAANRWDALCGRRP